MIPPPSSVLVFYDDGFAQYTTLDRVHLVCESGSAIILIVHSPFPLQDVIFGKRWQSTPESLSNVTWMAIQLYVAHNSVVSVYFLH